jgi:hypothetical protein
VTAQLAKVDDSILAGAEEAGNIRDGAFAAAPAKAQVGGMQFDCRYLSLRDSLTGAIVG